MNDLSARIARKLQSAYRGRRKARPARLRELRASIYEAVQDTNASSQISQLSKDPRTPPVQPSEPGTLVSQDGQANESGSPSDHADRLGGREDIHGVARNSFETEDWPELPRSNPHELSDAEAQWEHEQTIRNTKYVTYNGEDENDYTAGPARMVVSSDGIGDVGALLLTLDFSQKIQRALMSQRKYDALAAEASARESVEYRFDRKLRLRISEHEHHLRGLQRTQQGDDADAAAVAADEIAVVEDDLEKLRYLQEEAKGRRETLNASVSTAAMNLRRLNAEVNAYLEDAYVAALLLEPHVEQAPSSPIQDRTIEAEYEKLYRQHHHEIGALTSPEPFTPTHDYTPPPLSPSKQAKHDLLTTYLAASHTLQNATAAFDSRQEAYADAKRARTTDAASQTTSAFDIAWHAHERELTHALIAAESAERAAWAAARAGGVRKCEMDGTIPSVLASTAVAEVFEEKMERQALEAAVERVDRPRIRRWLRGVDAKDGDGPDPEVEGLVEWEARSVGVSDSLSAVAEGEERMRIDGWRRVCEGLDLGDSTTTQDGEMAG